MSEQRVRIGIIGAGGISYMHEAGYSEIDDLCELVAFCDIDEEQARERAEPHQASAYKLLPESQVDDHALAFGHLANGAVFATTQSCVTEAPWSERLEIHGNEGSLIVDQLANPPAIYFHGSNDIDGTPLPEVSFEPLAWKYLSIVAEVQDFVQAIREERTPVIDPLYGHHALQVVEAAYRSVAEKRSIAL